MKTIFLIALCGAVFWSVGFTGSQENNKKLVKRTEIISDSIDFSTRVQPILQKNCSPCHFPGGKLYEKLPFDTVRTILALKKERVLMRIKNEGEKELVKVFLEQQQ